MSGRLAILSELSAVDQTLHQAEAVLDEIPAEGPYGPAQPGAIEDLRDVPPFTVELATDQSGAPHAVIRVPEGSVVVDGSPVAPAGLDVPGNYPSLAFRLGSATDWAEIPDDWPEGYLVVRHIRRNVFNLPPEAVFTRAPSPDPDDRSYLVFRRTDGAAVRGYLHGTLVLESGPVPELESSSSSEAESSSPPPSSSSDSCAKYRVAVYPAPCEESSEDCGNPPVPRTWEVIGQDGTSLTFKGPIGSEESTHEVTVGVDMEEWIGAPEGCAVLYVPPVEVEGHVVVIAFTWGYVDAGGGVPDLVGDKYEVDDYECGYDNDPPPPTASPFFPAPPAWSPRPHAEREPGPACRVYMDWDAAVPVDPEDTAPERCMPGGTATYVLVPDGFSAPSGSRPVRATRAMSAVPAARAFDILSGVAADGTVEDVVRVAAGAVQTGYRTLEVPASEVAVAGDCILCVRVSDGSAELDVADRAALESGTGGALVPLYGFEGGRLAVDYRSSTVSVA